MRPHTRPPSPLETPVEHRLQIDDWGPVKRLQVANLDSGALKSENLHAMQSDRIRPVRGAGVENPLQGVGRPSPRVHEQHVAPGSIQPRQDEDVISDLQASKSFAEPRIEDKPGIRRSLVSLLGRGRPIDERRLDPPDWLQLVLHGAPFTDTLKGRNRDRVNCEVAR